tara:strand:- start:9209 stop:9649 length:441 start_codon:yes stop_codon:yes gene_type:complete
VNIIFTALTPTHHKWIKENLDPIFCDDTRGILALDGSTGEVLAAAVMDQWTINSCQTHIVIKNPWVIRHGFMHEVAHYIFKDSKRKMVFGLTPSNNKKAIKFNKHIGFREIGRLPEAYEDGVDYIIYQMDEADCKFLARPIQEEAA